MKRNISLGLIIIMTLVCGIVFAYYLQDPNKELKENINKAAKISLFYAMGSARDQIS